MREQDDRGDSLSSGKTNERLETAADVDAALVVVCRSPERTREVGALLGRHARVGDVILLHGDLGAGKTTLAQGIGAGLGVSDTVRSPTFTLVAEHDGRTPAGAPIRLYHLDLYRLGGEEDLDSFGFDTYLAPVDGLTVIEWPERAGGALPAAYLLVTLEPLTAEARALNIRAIPADGPYAARVAAWRRALSEEASSNA